MRRSEARGRAATCPGSAADPGDVIGFIAGRITPAWSDPPVGSWGAENSPDAALPGGGPAFGGLCPAPAGGRPRCA